MMIEDLTGGAQRSSMEARQWRIRLPIVESRQWRLVNRAFDSQWSKIVNGDRGLS